ncbi:glycosyltransferase [bacterium]|nr:glycosyltransferase [bacterium]
MPTVPRDRIIMIPTYNESATIRPLVDRIIEADPRSDILVIDDASPDHTADIVRAFGHIPSLPGRRGARKTAQTARGLIPRAKRTLRRGLVPSVCRTTTRQAQAPDFPGRAEGIKSSRALLRAARPPGSRKIRRSSS